MCGMWRVRMLTLASDAELDSTESQMRAGRSIVRRRRNGFAITLAMIEWRDKHFSHNRLHYAFAYAINKTSKL